MKKLIYVFGTVALMYAVACGPVFAQMGIGIKAPTARLHVYDGTFLSQTPELDPQLSPFYDPVNFDDSPVFRAFKWIHEKGAFRALGTGGPLLAWDPTNSGYYSFASGYDSYTTGLAGSAIGLRSRATGFGAFSTGQYVIGGDHLSFAQGYLSSSNGPHCITMGTNLENNYLIGAFIMGYHDWNAQSSLNNQMKMIFSGGYRLFTNSNLTTGALLDAGANAWSVISDLRKKENFEAVNGKEVLRKIARLPLSSWNYKDQEPAQYRHYGVMAQDFFTAFGKDSYGAIGADTTINQADLDGISLIAIQALVKETDELEKMNSDLEMQLARLRERVAKGMQFSHPQRQALLAVKHK